MTFDDGSDSRRLRRQSSQQPLIYNATQYFAAVAGDLYNLTAYAIQAQKGQSTPNYSINICVADSCSGLTPLTTSYVQYFFIFSAQVNDDFALATFSITCSGNAYVGLDSISITAIPPAASTASSTSSASGDINSEYSVDGGSASLITSPGGDGRTVTRTIVRTRTTSAILSTAYYYTTTQYVTSVDERNNTYTTNSLVPTTVVSTEYETRNVTVSAVITSTSKCYNSCNRDKRLVFPLGKA